MIVEVEQLVAEIEILDLEGLRNVWRERSGAPTITLWMTRSKRCSSNASLPKKGAISCSG
jgi:hypothetical protein